MTSVAVRARRISTLRAAEDPSPPYARMNTDVYSLMRTAAQRTNSISKPDSRLGVMTREPAAPATNGILLAAKYARVAARFATAIFIAT
jgi:hypothetical protein